MPSTYNQARILVRKYTANATLNLATEFGPKAQLVGFSANITAGGPAIARLLHPSDGRPIAQIFCALNENRSHFGDSFNTSAFADTLGATGIVGNFPSPLPVSTQTSLTGGGSAVDTSYRLDIAITGTGAVYVFYTND